MSAAANSLPDRNDARIRLAQSADVEALAGLINIAFRVELPFIEGDRVNPGSVSRVHEEGKISARGRFCGPCWLASMSKFRGDRGYLGLLGVEPRCQGTGLGRKLMDAAEDFSVMRTVSLLICELSARGEPLHRFLPSPRLCGNRQSAASARLAGKSTVPFQS